MPSRCSSAGWRAVPSAWLRIWNTSKRFITQYVTTFSVSCMSHLHTACMHRHGRQDSRQGSMRACTPHPAILRRLACV